MMTVPTCPGRLGIAAVDVARIVPEYTVVTVVNDRSAESVWGIWITTVPICPGRLGDAAVEVTTLIPE